MSGNGEETMRIDRALTMLRSDDDHGRVQLTGVLEFLNHFADRSIDELNLLKQKLVGCSGRVEVAATADAFLNQFLAYAHGLEVHSEKIGKACAAVAAMISAADFVQNRIHF